MDGWIEIEIEIEIEIDNDKHIAVQPHTN